MVGDGIEKIMRDIRRRQEMIDSVSGLANRFGQTSTLGLAAAERELSIVKRAQQLSEIGFLSSQASLFKQSILPKIPESFASRAFSDLQERMGSLASIERFSLPPRDDIFLIAQRAAEMVEPHRRFLERVTWRDDLAQRMASIGTSWAMPDSIAHSGFAFGALSKLSDVVHFDAPFAPTTRDFVEAEFGAVVVVKDDADSAEREERYDEAGRDAALVAFPAEEYPSVLTGAGFGLVIPPPPAPQPIENIDGQAIYSDEHHATLRAVEVHMRQFVSSQLMTVVGTKWVKQRVPGDMRQRWEEKRDIARASGQPVYELIHYADFNDLAQIITMKNNWEGLFEPVFGDKEGVQVSLRRLSPLRNNDAHQRPFCRTDILYLVAEATRLMRSIGILQVN
ncbi:Swt1 family HEPN domain-containing protein [Sphingobium sp. AN641]|uniref:Swt1 family HEPN domain-containing protein n=1 Tax=Sphingobium sp. AN641 TaxID=3133443 RepID=UPI0030BFBD41